MTYGPDSAVYKQICGRVSRKHRSDEMLVKLKSIELPDGSIKYVEDKPMKLEVGKYYKTRDGRKAGPMGWIAPLSNVDKYTFTIDGGDTLWHEDGHRFDKTDSINDLIAEWTDTPEIGTLAEIGAQVGDVVEMVTIKEEYVLEKEHMKVDENGGAVASHGRYDPIYDFRYGRTYRIITRAKPQGPVVEEATVTKRIVPGVYGKVEITTASSNDFFNVVVHPCLSRDDLISAHRIIEQLIDAMGDE